MITETAKVVAIDSDCLWVETIQLSTCASCSAQKGCGQSLVAKWGGQTSFLRVLLESRSPHDFSVGSEVSIGVPDGVVVRGALFVYLVPLLMMMVAIFTASYSEWSESGVIVLALLGLIVGGGVVRLHSYWYRDDVSVQPVLVDRETALQWG
jgi:sigma-E factor negative regulatory protein RseC